MWKNRSFFFAETIPGTLEHCFEICTAKHGKTLYPGLHVNKINDYYRVAEVFQEIHLSLSIRNLFWNFSLVSNVR